MRRTVFALLFLHVAGATVAHAQDCNGKPRFSINAKTGEAAIAFPGAVPATLNDGDKVTLVIGGQAMDATAHTVSFAGVNSVSLETPPIDNTLSEGFTSGDVSIKTTSGTVIDLCPLTALNYSMHAGPTVAVNNGSNSSGNDPAGVMRFQLQKALLRTIQVRSDPNLIPAMRNMQEELSVSIDTPDRQTKGTKFIDDNRIVGAVRSPEYSTALINRVRIGVEANFARAVHTEDRNRDIKLAIDGWLPFLPSVNLLSQGRTVTLPLSFHLSAGNRSQNVSRTKSSGRVAEAGLAYYFYLLNHYAVDLAATTLFNDLSDRPLSTPRTQRSYKAQVSYKQDSLSKFAVVASFENGHSGPVFTKLRQFFVGVGAQQLLGVPKSP
jgi:hypothetical protein